MSSLFNICVVINEVNERTNEFLFSSLFLHQLTTDLERIENVMVNACQENKEQTLMMMM
jgi:hypothetical protein